MPSTLPGDHAIHTAVRSFNFEDVKKLLEQGADVNARNAEYNTPLHIAVYYALEKIVGILLAYGADVSVRNCISNTPLDIATTSMHSSKMFQTLLNYGADANSKDVKGLSALHKAVIYHASNEVVDHLLQNGASLDAKDNYDMTPLNHAIDRKNYQFIGFILSKNPDLRDNWTKIVFCFLCIEGSLNCLDTTIIKCGFTLALEDFNDDFVPKKWFPSVKNKFENKEFRSKVQDILNRTATNLEEFGKLFLLYQVLKGSIERGFIDIVNNLLTPFVNINIPMTTGLTMLHSAIIKGHLPIVEKLLAFGADVNGLDESNKMSALHFCIANRREEIAAVLLKHNANTEVRNDSNQTPLDFAVSKFNYKIALLLLNAGANVNPDNLKSNNKFINAARDNLDFTKALLHFGALIDLQTILNLFTNRGRYTKNDFNRMKLFFNHNEVCSSDSSVEVESEDFISSCLKFQELIIKYVTFHGSSINSTEPKWYNFETKCQEEIAKMKLSKIEGFSISVDDVLRKTPRQIARDLKNEDFAQVLEQIDFKEKFPLYASKIRALVRKGEVTKQLLEITSLYLEEVLDFPVLVKEKILSYLNDQELRRLIFLSPIDEAKKASLQFKEDEVDDSDDDAQDNDFDSDDDDYSGCDDYY